ncbi:MAG: hypothetical protein V4598_19920 [Bdellovibrionota bacterium]
MKFLSAFLVLASFTLHASVECDVYGKRFIENAKALNLKINAGMEFDSVKLALEEEWDKYWLAIPHCYDSPVTSTERKNFCAEAPFLLDMRTQLIKFNVVIPPNESVEELLFHNQGMRNYVGLTCP